jgi:hypothetical protein
LCYSGKIVKAGSESTWLVAVGFELCCAVLYMVHLVQVVQVREGTVDLKRVRE